MKPATAAKKLGVYLEATPAEFREGVVSRDELNALQADPPEWLRELRRNGPHPRPVVAARLGVSISGLARGGISATARPRRVPRPARAPRPRRGWTPARGEAGSCRSGAAAGSRCGGVGRAVSRAGQRPWVATAAGWATRARSGPGGPGAVEGRRAG